MTTAAETESAALPAPPSGRTVIALVLGATLLMIPAMMLARLAAREVSQYHSSTFEIYAREALKQKRYDSALTYCEGALRSSLNRSDYYGTAYLLRAEAYDGLRDTKNALAEFNRAAAFWANKYYYATEAHRLEIRETATAAGLRLLGEGHADQALDAFSSAGLGSGDIVAYLYDLNERLTPEQRTKLWQKGAPCLIARRYVDAALDKPIQISEEQGRSVRSTGVDPTTPLDGQPSASIDLGAASKPGRSWHGVPAYIRLADRPFGVRVYAKADGNQPFTAMLGFWFESAQRSENTPCGKAEAGPDGWQVFSTTQDLYRERLAKADKEGYLVSDGIINSIILEIPQGPAAHFWVNRVEIVLPAS